MMRRVIFLALIIVLLYGLPSYAKEGKAVFVQGSVKIGYVDFNRALNGVKDGRVAKKRLKDEFKEKQQKLDKMQKDLAALKNDIDQKRLLVSDPSMKKKEEEYRTGFFELQQMLSAFQREMENREATLTRQILKKLRGIVDSIGKQDGYSLILEKSQDVVLYAPRGDDITDKVISTYDRGKGR
ncbi:MAG: OmpH family outer membrane protein [Deltaproteobacteria bacterium]|jgi:outer membrane protein|nr:OmpH family outer membrane protein [Deltaproteobacteria bacterium]